MANEEKVKAFSIPFGEMNGELLHVSQVQSGLKCGCVCPVCKEPLVARKGDRKAHHFGHKPNANCSKETVLHYLGKKILLKRISNHMKDSEPLRFSWKCSLCGDAHQDDLIKLAYVVELEKDCGICRPDILISGRGTPSTTYVEVVVTHKPDETVIEHASKWNINLVEFRIKASADLEVLETAEVLTASKANYCTRPKCPKCKGPLRRKAVNVVDGNCWKCKAQMKIALLHAEGIGLGIGDGTEQDVAIARQHGAILLEKYSKSVGSSYLANVCGKCDSMTGSFYLHDFYHLATPENEHKSGWVCVECIGEA